MWYSVGTVFLIHQRTKSIFGSKQMVRCQHSRLHPSGVGRVTPTDKGEGACWKFENIPGEVQRSDHVYLRHLSTEYWSILSANMATDSWPIYRPILNRYVGRDSVDISTDINRHAWRPTPGRYFTATRLILYRHRRPTLRSFVQLLLLSSIFSSQLRGAFSACRPLLAFNSGNIHVFFSSYVFSSSSLLYTTLVTFGSSSIWGLSLRRFVILGEQKMM